MSKRRNHKKKLPLWLRIVLIIILIPIVLALILGAVYLFMRLAGESTLDGTVNNIPPVMEMRGDDDSSDYEIVDSKTVRYNGKEYTYNDDTYNILLMGIDSDLTVEDAEKAAEADQADVIILAAVDKASGKGLIHKNKAARLKSRLAKKVTA